MAGSPGPRGPLLYSRGARPCQRTSEAVPFMNRQPLTVAVVGATGVVGRTMIQILNEREFPVGELRLLASGRSAGRTVSIDGRTLEIGEAVPEAFDGVDIALFSAGADASRDLAPAAVACGATVIDNSSAWRMDPTIPLVVSQVNPDDLEGHPGIVANPNCSTMQLAPVLMALRDAVGLDRVVVDTYQSVSGTGGRCDRRAGSPDPGARRRRGPGRDGLPAPDRVQRAARDRRLPRQRLHQGGVEGRHRESQDPRPARPADLVHGRPHPGLRQPLRGGPRRDARSDHARSRARAVRGRARAWSSTTTRPSIATRWRPRRPVATRSSSAASDATSRSQTTAALAFWVVSDNLRKGAATNAVELAEVLHERGWIKPASARGARAYRALGATDSLDAPEATA